MAQRMMRYATAATGPVLVAGAQFLFMALQLSRLSVADYGRLAFVIVVGQFGVGVWAALFSAPLVLAASERRPEMAQSCASIAQACYWALLPAGLVVGVVALAIGTPLLSSALLGAYTVLMLLRQFLRAWRLAHHTPLAATASDICFAIVLLLALVVAMAIRGSGMAVASLPLLAAATAGLLVILPSTHLAPVKGLRTMWRGYRAIWRRDSRWTLFGVLTTELTVNSHSYLVVAVFGADAYAPIAATALMIRPMTVLINALTEFERPRFARELSEGRLADAAVSRRHMHYVLAAAWLINLAAAMLFLWKASQWLFHGRFDASILLTGTLLWFAVVMARGLHAPEGVIQQAGGHFRSLAWVSAWTSVISVAAVTVTLMWGQPLWSIAGIILGEGCFALALRRSTLRLLRSVT